mmetsp:Transcript_20439/g.19656  ORF Transcript_20439/g.19656 Transcript_20439/m.19656 type:complete len:293 (-) Transcript_20439:33-911(-)
MTDSSPTSVQLEGLNNLSISKDETSESRPYGIRTSVDVSLNVDTVDIYYHMRNIQTNFVSPESFNPDFPFLSYRRQIVDWMNSVGEQCELACTTIHASIFFLDKLLLLDHIPMTQLKFYAAVCISLAAKFEEAEELCPTSPEFLKAAKLIDEGVTSASFLKGEMTVIKLLGYKLRAITPSHITRYFGAKGVVFHNDTYKCHKLTKKIPSRIKKYSLFFCNLAVQEYSFQKYLPSQLAAGIIMASRHSVQIQPLWRPELVRLTGYDLFEIEPIFAHLWRYYEEQFPSETSTHV